MKDTRAVVPLGEFSNFFAFFASHLQDSGYKFKCLIPNSNQLPHVYLLFFSRNANFSSILSRAVHFISCIFVYDLLSCSKL
ncbi:hypothetical protein HOLleu_27817 [Holothuria leucospilota]|uniref:Uncharacterized protein n=1 Tax=Holothuria leucospilota TaxID=206669 RepID=A0A9Q1BQT7_HOLLE|nr:hypothetical protein HOLleu_27817 [Holothuria leucospilota]